MLTLHSPTAAHSSHLRQNISQNLLDSAASSADWEASSDYPVLNTPSAISERHCIPQLKHLSSASTQSPHLARCSSADMPKAPVCIHFVADLARQRIYLQARSLHSASLHWYMMTKRLSHVSCTPLQCIVAAARAFCTLHETAGGHSPLLALHTQPDKGSAFAGAESATVIAARACAPA